MNKGTKIIIGVVVAIVVIAGIWYGVSRKPAPAPTAKEPIKIGAILPLTGDAAGIGQNTRAAIELATEQINNKGGIDGRNLEIIFENGMCNPKEAANAANKLVNIEAVPVIIGAACSSETLAAAPITEGGKTVLFSPCSSSPDITTAGDYVFRDYPSDDFQGEKGAEIAYNTLKAKKAAILYCLSDYCVGVEKVFKEKFKELGGTIVAEESYEQTSRDLRTQLTKIKNANPDLLYFIGYTEASIVGLKQIKELGIESKILGVDAWDDPKIPEEAREASEGIMYTIPFTPLTEEFKAAMKSKTGTEEITVCAPQAYDAVNIVAEIMKKVGTESEKIKNELYKVKDYKGVSGTISFDENGDLATANYILKIVKEGKAVEYK